MEKKNKKNKRRIVEELLMEDSVELNNICSYEMNNLECSSSGDSPKKKHKRKQRDGNAKEALISDPRDVTFENVISKKKKKQVKECEVLEYSGALEKVVRKKNHKKKSHGKNSVTGVVHFEYSHGEKRMQKIENADVDVKNLLEKSIEEQFLRKDQVAVLDNLCVSVPFDIPPLHLIETQIVKALTPSEKRLVTDLDLTVKTGVYSKNEDEQIKHNWEQFCQHHSLNKEEPYLFTRFKHQNAGILPASERFKFLRFLAHGMPDRLLSSVYRRFQRNFRTKTLNSGRYTAAEDKIIIDYMKTHTGQVYLELGQILNRDRYSVESRYKKLTTERVSGTWSVELSQKLVDSLQKCCGVSKSELEHWDISPEEWKRVEKKMKIPVRILKRAWLHIVYVRLFIDGRVNSKHLRLDLIGTVYESGADDWRTINWSEIARKYKGFTPERICKIYKDLVAGHVPKKLHADLRKSAVHLRDEVSKHENPNKYLKKRIYKKLNLK